MVSLKDRAVALVVTGGIAAYKSAELARMLIREGARVRVAMTEAATRFITPLTFQTLTREPVAFDLWQESRPFEVGHISLSDWAEVVVIAPATANVIAKMAFGLADDFVSTFLLAVRSPIVVCPSMNVNMFENPVVQENLARIRALAYVVEPGSGFLACGWEGKGRLPDLEIIVEEIRFALTKKDMAGLTVMVTSGPTREPWDDIRFLSNRSSGRMGAALARSARLRGAEVILVSGPTSLAPPLGVETINVETTLDMQAAVNAHLDRCHVLIKAAAPADFRPARRVQGKVKKNREPEPIALARNPDILLEVGRNRKDRILVGFAAEAENLIENAKAKLKAKNLDLIVANQIGLSDEAFGAETNRVHIICRDETVVSLPLMTKSEVAERIWDQVLDLVTLRQA